MTFKINRKQFFDFEISISSRETRLGVPRIFLSSSSRIAFRTLINKFFIKFATHQQTSDAVAYNKKPREKNLARFSRNPESYCKLTCSSKFASFRNWFFKFHPEKLEIWKVCERYSLCKSFNLVPDSVCADYCDPDRTYRFYTCARVVSGW